MAIVLLIASRCAPACSATDAARTEDPDAADAGTDAFGDHPDDPLHCPRFEPCGGDPTGAWEWDDLCTATWDAPQCEPDRAVWSIASGPMKFDANGTVTYEIATRDEVYRRTSPECAHGECAADGAKTSCSLASDGSCLCASERLPVTSTMIPGDGAIAWKVEGAQLFLGDAPQTLDYCVRGDVLEIYTTDLMPRDTPAEKYFRLHRSAR